MRKKIDASQYNTDKVLHPPHLTYYAEYFEPFLDQDIRLLELGVDKGGSLLLWRDYFEHGIITGLDINPLVMNDPTERIRVFQGSQADIACLDRIAVEIAPDGFDIIIDDCSHIGEMARTSFWHLFDHRLKPGGIYAIEDWGTGYWESWPDGKRYTPFVENPSFPAPTRSIFSNLAHSVKKLLTRQSLTDSSKEGKRRFYSHEYGMVGFVKQLIDECGMADITCPGWGLAPVRPSKFEKMHISHGLVIIVKAKQSE